MQILLIRHGIAVDPERFAATGATEPERPLTDRGFKRTKRAARGLRRVVQHVDLIASSPFQRALQTAQVFSQTFRGAGTPEVLSLTGLEPGGEPHAVLDWLGQLDPDKTVALVGHEPDMSRLAALLTTGGAGEFFHFGKAGAALLRCADRPQAGNMELIWLLSPAILRRLGL